MSLFASQSREQLRLAYAEAWRKHREGVPVSPLEALIADVIERHPEYQALLMDAAAAVSHDAAPGQENPFLHMGLHLAIREQLAIDRPPGVRALAGEIQSTHADPHRAEHVLMEALAETLFAAQSSGRTPDEQEYLALARKRASALSSGRRPKHGGS
jgi:hypothetical protein